MSDVLMPLRGRLRNLNLLMGCPYLSERLDELGNVYGSVVTEEFAHPCRACGTTNHVKVHYLRSAFITGGGKKLISYKDETIRDLADTVNMQANIIKSQMEEIERLRHPVSVGYSRCRFE